MQLALAPNKKELKELSHHNQINEKPMEH